MKKHLNSSNPIKTCSKAPSIIGIVLICVFSLLAFPETSTAKAKIIFDTGFGGDADDLGALAMLNHFENKGETGLLAMMCWNTAPWVKKTLRAESMTTQPSIEQRFYMRFAMGREYKGIGSIYVGKILKCSPAKYAENTK
jgi:hypothetical protein